MIKAHMSDVFKLSYTSGGFVMVKRMMLAVVLGLFGLSLAIAAEAIKIDLKAAKLKSANDDVAGYDEGENRVFLYTNGTITADVKVPEDGEYTLKLEAGCTEADKEKAKIKITIGGEVVKEKFDLTAEEAKEYPFTVKLKKGDTKLVVEFLNDKYKENEYDLNFFLYKASIEKK
jgi:Ca-dependent carbohydrate-binding module xylan-binding